MAEAGGQGAQGGGNGAGAGSGGAGGNTGAGGTGAASGAGGAGGTNAAAPWHGITDPEVASYVDNKGWKTPADIVTSYRGAEKFVGRDPSTLIAIPRADDAEGFRAVAAKLGMPEKATDYKLDTLKDFPVDPAYQSHVQELFHKAGLTAAQAAAVSKGHNEFMAKAAQQAAKDYDLNVEADKRALQKDWGAGYDRMISRAQNAARSLEIPPEAIDAMEEKIGFAGVMKLMATIGTKLGEDSLGGGAGTGAVRFGSQMTTGEAQAEWDAMKADDKVRAALFDGNHPGHKAAVEKQRKLFAIIHGEAPVI